jgi:hypothetical protein
MGLLACGEQAHFWLALLEEFAGSPWKDRSKDHPKTCNPLFLWLLMRHEM